MKIEIVILCLFFISTVAFGNSLSNSNFELGTVAATWNDAADVTSWIQTGGTAVDNKAHLSDGGWVGASGTQFDESAVSTYVTAGDKAVKWRWGNKGIYQNFSTAASTEYYFAVEVLNDPGFSVTGRNLQIRVSWYNGSGGAITTNTVVAEYDPTAQNIAGHWYMVVGSMTSPSTAASGRMELWSQSKTANTGVFFADNAYASDTPIEIDTTAPTPNPMTFAIVPFAIGSSAISMEATAASDDSGVQYYFTCTSGGGSDSGWQSSAFYTDIGLVPETTYTYTVKARDQSSAQNETDVSGAEQATTLADSANTSLLNGDFEIGETGQFNNVLVPGWVTWGEDGTHHTEVGQVLGTKAIKISAMGTGAYQDITAIGDYQYYVSAEMASFGGSNLVDRDGGLKLEWFNGSTLVKTEPAGYFVGGLYSDDEWKTIGAVVSSPEIVTKLRVVLHVKDFPEGALSPAGTCYFDNVTVTPIGEKFCSPGDLTEDCLIDMYDVAELSLGWNDVFGVAELAEVVTYWLECTMYDQALCFE